jgi:endonuclease YncB( thermonuclease family)
VVGVVGVCKQGCTSFFCGVSRKKENTLMPKLILFSLLCLSFYAFSAEITGRVIGVSDGDTITVLDDMDQGKFRIRLDKIDAPEKKQAFGNKARQYLSTLIFGKKVSIRFKRIDNYGRVLGIVFLNGTEINRQMVQSGFAWHYSYYDKTPAYIEAEKRARAEKQGLWLDPAPINPFEFRKMNKKR